MILLIIFGSIGLILFLSAVMLMALEGDRKYEEKRRNEN